MTDQGWSQDDDTEIKEAVARLAALSPIQFDRIKKEEAEGLGCGVVALEKEVKAARRGQPQKTELFPDLEPWPDPVDGAALLDTIAGTLERHVIAPKGAADAMALWTLHAHAHDAAYISPLLAITSPSPSCGKTTSLTLLGALVPKPIPASNITAAALFRAVERWAPTLLVDEADSFLRDSDELRGIINSGHNRGNAYVLRTIGDEHEPKLFRTWAPKAIALIGKLPPTLASRSIHIELRRMAAGEFADPVRPDRLGHLQPLARQAARWAADKMAQLQNSEPELPTALVGRSADNWRAIIAIADAAGGDWPERARRTAETMTATTDQDQTAGIMMLADIKDIIDDRDRIQSSELATKLSDMEDKPWPEWRGGKSITVPSAFCEGWSHEHT